MRPLSFVSVRGNGLFAWMGPAGKASSSWRDVGKGHIRLTLETERCISPPPGGAWLALAWTKALRRSWLLEKAVELEAGGLWFWQAARSQGRMPPEAKDSWRGQLLAGAKQSGNPWLPELRVFPEGLDGLLASSAPFARKWILCEDPRGTDSVCPEMLQDVHRSLFVLGPEGGFSPEERSALTGGGFLPVSLGRRVLRWETAALLCLGLCWWSRQRMLAQEERGA